MKPLKGIKVLDLSRVLAGPICGQTLGDLGAEVIKIESLGMGDESRAWPPLHKDMATAFITANRNKKSLALDLKSSEGQTILHQLAKDADVVIESSATGVSERLGADYDTLKEINDQLIYCSISGFGRTGPLKDMRGYDMVLQAYSGIMSLTGDKNSSAIRIPFSPVDQATGYHAVTGVLAALLERANTKRGSFIDVSLFETAVSFLGYMIQAYLENGNLPSRTGSRHSGIAPYQAFECADRTVLIGIANDKLWRSFCQDFNVPELIDDPRFAANSNRVANCDELAGIVQSLVGPLHSENVLARLQKAGIPCSPINTLEDIVKDPQVAQRGLLKALSQGDDNPMKAVVMPIVFNGEDREVGEHPPVLGQHTATILQNLGYSDDDVKRLENTGVIQCHNTH